MTDFVRTLKEEIAKGGNHPRLALDRELYEAQQTAAKAMSGLPAPVTARSTANAAPAYYAKSRQVQAVQWTGTEQSLQAIQDLIRPSSPLYEPRDLGKSLGIKVANGGGAESQFVPYSLKWVDSMMWVVKDGDGRVDIYTDANFKALFVGETEELRAAIGAEALAEVQPGVPPLDGPDF